MTSEERRAARYQRRVAKRKAHKEALYGQCDNFDSVFGYGNLYKAYRICRRGVCWKASVQKYVTQAPLRLVQTYRKLIEGTYKSPGFYEFDYFERGKKRHIKSTIIDDRVVQRCLCDNSIVPMMERSFIYDNGASMKFKGYHFSHRRLVTHLHRHFRAHGAEGYVLLFDFTRFFDNVSHDVVKQQLHRAFTDERILKLTERYIDSFGDRGMVIGSQISQVLALSSANRLDHYIKEVLRIKHYGRYMDDGYLIHESKEYLQKCLAEIQRICNELGIVLNKKKTQIVKLTHGFTYLKARMYLTSTGKVVRKIHKRSVTRMRIKLKKMKRMFDAKKITSADVYMSWQSWKSYAEHFNAWHTIQNMAALYDRLFMNWEEIYAIL